MKAGCYCLRSICRSESMFTLLGVALGFWPPRVNALFHTDTHVNMYTQGHEFCYITEIQCEKYILRQLHIVLGTSKCNSTN